MNKTNNGTKTPGQLIQRASYEQRAGVTPSPLNGERAGVRGAKITLRPPSPTALPVARVSLVGGCRDGRPFAATQPKSSREPTGHHAIDGSKNVACECSVISDTHHVPRPWPAVRESHAGRRRVQYCNAPRHSKNPGHAAPSYAAAGICSRQSGGHAGCATVSFPLPWASCAASWRCQSGSLTAAFFTSFKKRQAPIGIPTPHPGPLPVRGERTEAHASVSRGPMRRSIANVLSAHPSATTGLRLHPASCERRAGLTPSPLNGERGGVRGAQRAPRPIFPRALPPLGIQPEFHSLGLSNFVALKEIQAPFGGPTPHPRPLPVRGEGISEHTSPFCKSWGRYAKDDLTTKAPAATGLRLHPASYERCAAPTPSPLNGERDGVRGEKVALRAISPPALLPLGIRSESCSLPLANFAAVKPIRTSVGVPTPHPGPLPVEGRGDKGAAVLHFSKPAEPSLTP
jgi:hypothetical protein